MGDDRNGLRGGYLQTFSIPWEVVLAAHGIFAYRIVTARKLASGQRAIDLERFRALSNREP